MRLNRALRAASSAGADVAELEVRASSHALVTAAAREWKESRVRGLVTC